MSDRFENYSSSRDKVVDAVAARLEEIFTNRRLINAIADYEKARDLGVQVLTEEEFQLLLDERKKTDYDANSFDLEEQENGRTK